MTGPEDELALDDHLHPDERDIEAPSVDAAEQATTVGPNDGAQPVAPLRRSLEVGEWDAFEQSIVIDIDDDYDR
ncbi:MAG TPA: hypothetical protein VKZ74_00510 [Natronosporangium sp.]|nr:hypothetical protein [Natronosporangium sp.]